MMYKVCLNSRFRVMRVWFLTLMLAFVTPGMYGAGWTPSDGGLTVNLNQGDEILLSVWVDTDGDGVEDPGEEFFVVNYDGYTGGYFNYTAGSYLKLLPQEPGATKPSNMFIWTVGAPLVRTVDKQDASLGGIVYTIWNDGKTLRTGSSNWQFYGDLTGDYSYKDACDVAFVIPTDRTGIISFDPNKTMNRADQETNADKSINGRFNGKTGTGFLGMTYREVYWLEIPRENMPVSYTNAALVTFNTTLSDSKSWSAGTIKPGMAAFAFADTENHATTRTIFRIYMLDDPINSCGSYYFATDVQNKNKKYRLGPGGRERYKWTDSTTVRKIYTWDHLYCMEHVGDASSKIYKSDYMKVPAGATSNDDSLFYYVGKHDTYVNDANKATMKLNDAGTAVSQFKYIDSLRIFALKDSLQPNGKPFIAPEGAYGRMVVDTTSTENNLAVAFEPKGYFFQTNSGRNVSMRQVDDSTWMVEDMWYIDPAYMTLQARIMLYTGAEFSEVDPGAAIEGWSVYEDATAIPVVGGGTASGKYGWARIHTNRATQNGGMEFVVADQTKYVRYDNNGHFGAAIPDQHPEYGKKKVAALAPRLMEGYNFTGWNTEANGSGTPYNVGDSVDLSGGPVTLFAQAAYTGSIHVAISFMQDGKRYFLTHPGLAPRFAGIRHFDDWTNVWQGVEDVNNNNPDYISTYKIIGNPTCVECDPDEYVLDPSDETMKGAVDSLVFYENFHPDKEEYLGLYYVDPYLVIANNTWAGLFTSSAGWPTPANACVASTQLSSDSYLERDGESVIQKYARTETPKDPASAALPAHIQYNSGSSVFDAVTGDGTDFMISGVGVVDEHYIIQPDTSEVWRDTITFGFHEAKQTTVPVWTGLWGKQLLAQMKVGGDTIYFHPNRDKVINDPNNLYLASEFRISEVFEFIRDSRVTSVAEEDRATRAATSNHWRNNILSGMTSPMDVKDKSGNYIDIVDTFRITMSQGGTSKIKKYYGRWADNAPGLKKSGLSRTREVIVRTKTYHYGPATSRLVLTPEKTEYAFDPMANKQEEIRFVLTRETSQPLLDKDGNQIRVDITDIDTITNKLQLQDGYTTLLKGGSSPFEKVGDIVGNSLTLRTKAINETEGDELDTLRITRIQVDGTNYDMDVRVPLRQTSLICGDLIWSVVKDDVRYYILPASTGLVFQQYNRRNNTLYKQGTTTSLIIGCRDDKSDPARYITPWTYAYPDGHMDQLTLADTTFATYYLYIDDADSYKCKLDAESTKASVVTFRYVCVNTNDNGNAEEVVRLKYGADRWLVFDGEKITAQVVDSADATVFSWAYPQREYNLQNNGTYPSEDTLTFVYNRPAAKSTKTLYSAYKEYSMLVGNQLTYLCRTNETNIVNLLDEEKEWKTDTTFTLIRDARPFDAPASSGLSRTITTGSLTSNITPNGNSPKGVTIGGKYVDIVDTLRVRLGLKPGAPEYRFKGAWSSYTSIEQTWVDIPLIRKTYHDAEYDSLVCIVGNNEYNYTFPSTITPDVNDTHEFTFQTQRRTGTHVLDVDDNTVAITGAQVADSTSAMHLDQAAYAEIRLADEYGNTPGWCTITGKTAHTVTVKCTESGIRSPRSAYLYIAYFVMVKDPSDGDKLKPRFINFRVTVSQSSRFAYLGNQILVHSKGASGDSLVGGVQQVHENKRILYYYPDQDTELPVRERSFFGWWRWFREGNDTTGTNVEDTDVPDSLWRTPPRNVGKYNFPFRTIGKEKDDKVTTMGRYTVFHYRSSDYESSVRRDPPSKNPALVPPDTRFGYDHLPSGKHPTLTYAVDISNYYDHLPMSLAQKNQVDTALLDTMPEIPEPTLSLREVFELRPWTEMADTLEHYKYADADLKGKNTYMEPYMEDHVVMAPLGHRLLLRTEQRYNRANLQNTGHSESLLGYYMRDDNWDKLGWSPVRQDSMIWCGGWDADMQWYSYNPHGGAAGAYKECNYTVTEGDDFLSVPARTSIAAGYESDTIYYFLRARSLKTTGTPGVDEETTDGDNMFNICRYTVIVHRPDKYGPLLETKEGDVTKALITNDEILQHYEVLERLDFDYNQPGSDYTVYPHPLPWSDVSYGYCYPETPDLPHNRCHKQTDFPITGEYGLVNRIPEASHWNPATTYWYPMEQHGGAENGYMIYCDGMSSAGQVAALSLSTKLCTGQNMYFSGYVGNPSSQKGKSDPNFTFSVQGSVDGSKWDDITSYMTGDLEPSTQWYQIYFPITYDQEVKNYQHFRVRIYNVANSFDGNDFIIDDMCLFATKPPLVAYDANTACMERSENDSLTHVILRVDYKGFVDDSYNGKSVYYTVAKGAVTDDVFTPTEFIHPEDGYFNEDTLLHKLVDKPDTIYGSIPMPAQTYEPEDNDSIFGNLKDLLHKFELTDEPGKTLFRQGYIYENLDDSIRPVMYVVHKAKLAPKNHYKVYMSTSEHELLGTMCAMTSNLKVNNRIALELNGMEQEERVITEGLCANTTYDLSLRIKGSQYLDSVAPIDVSGSCKNDWLLYGDTADVTGSPKKPVDRYGYTYEDIVKVVHDILRTEHAGNTNQFAQNLSSVSSKVMDDMKTANSVTLTTSEKPYKVLSDLVNNGYLTLYKSQVTTTVASGDSLQYIVMPIIGTGSKALVDANVEVCPTPIFIKLKPTEVGEVPMMVGGMNRSKEEAMQPLGVLASEVTANDEIAIRIDSIATNELGALKVVVHSVVLHSTNDPNFRTGIDVLTMTPDRIWNIAGDNTGYYQKGDTILLQPAKDNTYTMQPGYSYTYNIVMQTPSGSLNVDPADPTSCAVGSVPFTINVVPNQLRWDPKSTDNAAWNNPDNWIGINQQNQPIHSDAHFAPLAGTDVIIPAMTDGKPYPVVPDLSATSTYDSVKQVGFEYNTCEKIRFMPGAAMGQQQRMTYTNAIVDLSTPHGKWALRSAPVTGVLSGDVFMSDADLTWSTSPWEVGGFDANGRNSNTGNASYYLSMYNTQTVQVGYDHNDTIDAKTEWIKVNAMTQSLPPAQGWAVYTYTKSLKDAAVRLPKNDDVYYYYTKSGEKNLNQYENDLCALRETNAAAAIAGSHAGELAFHPAGSSQAYTLRNGVASTTYVFGNPTMGYIDIWGFLSDNKSVLEQEIRYIDKSGNYTTVETYESAAATTDTITEEDRYLPPMHAMILTAKSGSTSLELTLNANRVVTWPSQKVARAAAPRRSTSGLPKGIMTVTAVNPVSPRCKSRLLLGQGYHKSIRDGEDAVLMTINIDDFSMTKTPTTPFNIYAVEGGHGLSIDLSDSLLNVPISFYKSDLPYDPATQLWFTGVNHIDGQLVLYDALTGSERQIIDGICLTIETPEQNHEKRYYIRRRGYTPSEDSNPIATDTEYIETDGEAAVKFIKDGHVFILRNGHIYTMFGQKVR